MQNYSYPCCTESMAPKREPDLVIDYKKYLLDVRGVACPRSQLATVRCFLAFLDAVGIPVESVGKGQFDRFLLEQGRHYEKRTVASISSFLRGFLRYLTAVGIVADDLSHLVERPRVVRGERDPRFLKSHQVAATLDTMNLRTVVGMRDRAILTLLAVYGLRSCEAARIRLEDILWRSETLRIRHRRCGDTLELPLVPAAARALAEYVKVRPETPHREVFLTKFRPYHPIDDSALGQAAHRALTRAGIEVPRAGAQTFRYSHAQALFEAERPLPEIASALGHSDLRTTLGYLQITVHPLREVALNDGEDLA